MAKRNKLTAVIHIPINGKYYKWYEVDEDGNEKWYLPRDEPEAVKAVEKMLDNVGKGMSRFYTEHPELVDNFLKE